MGLGYFSMWLDTSCPRDMARSPSGVPAVLTSNPAENPLSPAPVMITALTALSASHSVSTASSSLSTDRLIGLAGGLLRVMIPVRSSRSTIKFS